MATPARATGRFDALDGMRALACYAVMATHVGFETARSFGTSPLAPWLARLDASVPIFLMLSGFLLYRPFVVAALRGRPSPNTIDFYWRRAVRVLPAFWLATIVTLGLLSTRSASPKDWLAYLTLTQIYDGHNLDPSLTHMWTLVVEVSFYAVLPVIALSLRRARTANNILRQQCGLLGGLFLASVGWQVLTFHVAALGLTATTWLPGTIDWFALGMFLAVLSALPPECTALPRLRGVLSQWAGSPGLCWTVALGLFWFVTLPLGGPLDLAEPSAWQHVTKNVLEGVLVFFMMLPLTLGRPGLIWQVMGNRVSRFLGEISYGVYLWHLPMLILLQRELHLPVFQGRYWEFFLLTAASSTALGTLSWYLFERPLLGRFSRPSWRGQPVPATARQIPTTQSA
ncbi:MAG: acyltransferase family protein [Jatrophihabitans sp.]